MTGFFVWRQNNVGVYDASKGVYRSGNTMRGVSDILGLHKATGKFVAVEVKVGKDSLSAYQTLFAQNIRNGGGIALVAHNFDGFKKEIDEIIEKLTPKLLAT